MSRHLRVAVDQRQLIVGWAPRLLFLLACLAVASASPAGERGEGADAPKQCFERLVEGMTRERHKLQSGCFRATGTKAIDAAPNTGVSEERVREVAQAQIALQAEVQIFAAFDAARDRLRFDWIQPLRLSVSITGPPTIDMLTTRYARRPEYELTFHWEAINEPLPEERFHYQDFDVGEKAIISDLRPFERSVTEDHRNAQTGERRQGQGD